jgi:hypothetical protein
MPYPFDQVGVWGFQYQMKVVGHEAKAVDLASGFLASLLQGSQETPAIGVIAVDRLFVIPAIHDVINCARILNAHLSSHQCEISKAMYICQLGKDDIIID